MIITTSITLSTPGALFAIGPASVHSIVPPPPKDSLGDHRAGGTVVNGTAPYGVLPSAEVLRN
jgi:hypothetical protein